MTPEDATKWLPILRAYADGKEIQGRTDSGSWESARQWSFADPVDNYRVKPRTVLRPWRAEEVPVGALWRYKDSPDTRCLILGVTQEGYIQDTEGAFSRQTALEKFEWLTNDDNWLPCGVEEECE